MKHKHTLEELQSAVDQTTSVRRLLLFLGIAAKGGNYKTVLKRLSDHNIDTSHFTGKGWAKDKIFGPKTPTEKYLTNEVPIESNRLKKRLLSEGILSPICSSCDLREWLGGPIPLELDHISGDNMDNRLCNLRLLCPNCHALTPTYRGKNKQPKT